jgi:hypothetical protein
MFFTATKSLVAGLVLLAVIALTAGQGGPCPNGAWPDKGGCCPVVIGNVPYYRDASGCYPRLINNKLYYPDTNKFAPALRSSCNPPLISHPPPPWGAPAGATPTRMALTRSLVPPARPHRSVTLRPASSSVRTPLLALDSHLV